MHKIFIVKRSGHGGPEPIDLTSLLLLFVSLLWKQTKIYCKWSIGGGMRVSYVGCGRISCTDFNAICKICWSGVRVIDIIFYKVLWGIKKYKKHPRRTNVPNILIMQVLCSSLIIFSSTYKPNHCPCIFRYVHIVKT